MPMPMSTSPPMTSARFWNTPLSAYDAHGEGHHTDDRTCAPDVDPHESEAHAHGEGVDAGGHGQQQKPSVGQGRLPGLVVVAPEGGVDHASADKGQQNKGDPGAEPGDVMAYGAAQQPAQQGHDKLKCAEVHAHEQAVANVESFDRQSAGDGHGKGVQGQTHGDEKDIQHCDSSGFVV